MERHLKEFCRCENGQGLSEYALLLAAVAVMAAGVWVFFAGQIGILFNALGVYIGGSTASPT